MGHIRFCCCSYLMNCAVLKLILVQPVTTYHYLQYSVLKSLLVSASMKEKRFQGNLA